MVGREVARGPAGDEAYVPGGGGEGGREGGGLEAAGGAGGAVGEDGRREARLLRGAHGVAYGREGGGAAGRLVGCDGREEQRGGCGLLSGGHAAPAFWERTGMSRPRFSRRVVPS
ncbi:hypothetical protein GCM10020000_76570 [Streptomyces olivoverticillatus]